MNPHRGKRGRRGVACTRCHSHKIKCSGERPCLACKNAGGADACHYPVKDRNVQVPKSYLLGLEQEVERLKSALRKGGGRPSPSGEVSNPSYNVHPVTISADASVSGHDIPSPSAGNDAECTGSAAPQHMELAADSSCTAFADQLLSHVGSTSNADPVPASEKSYFRHEALQRSSEPRFDLPNRMQASLLIQRALRFLGTDYHLIRRKSFFEQLEKVYLQGRNADRIWMCSLFVMLALGELYSNWHGDASETTVPGTRYYLQAMSLIEDRYEDASIEYLQALNLMSFYSTALGRSQSAYVYAGIALRMALSMGLHQPEKLPPTLTAVQREEYCRVWWTVYLFDRLLCSHLGYPLAIQDEDISVELPSMDRLDTNDKDEFADPAHLVANIRLARIIGKMMNTIYCLPDRRETSFVHRVHLILASLRSWDGALPQQLRRWDHSSPRNVFSLHLAYNQCIIKTTRPILLNVFVQKFGHGYAVVSQHKTSHISPTARALTDACVKAACTSNSILSRLFVEGNLATFGYFDAQYLFSSTLVLIMSAVLNPDASISDAVQTAFQLLKSMAETGNLPARGYYDRLCCVRSAIENMRKHSLNVSPHGSTVQDNLPGRHANASGITPNETPAAEDQRMALDVNSLQYDQQLHDVFGFEALDNPFIEEFLAGGAERWAGASGSPLQADPQSTDILEYDFLLSQP